MQNKNFVAPLVQQTQTMPPPEILPAGGLNGMFGNEQTNVRFSGIDPVREAMAFHLKYALLFVLNILVVTSFAWHYRMSFPIWFVIMAIVNYIGYWVLGTTESLLNPHAGHVVRSFFAWLTARDYIRANERLQTQYNLITYKKLEIEQEAQSNARAIALQQVQRHSLPQNELNRLVSYDEAGSFDEEDEVTSGVAYTIPRNEFKNPKDEARTLLLDFVVDLYSGEAIKPDGTLKKGTVAPWADSSDLSITIKRRMLDLIRQTEPKLFLQEGTRPWRLNVESYPTVDEAISILDTTVTRNV